MCPVFCFYNKKIHYSENLGCPSALTSTATVALYVIAGLPFCSRCSSSGGLPIVAAPLTHLLYQYHF